MVFLIGVGVVMPSFFSVQFSVPLVIAFGAWAGLFVVFFALRIYPITWHPIAWPVLALLLVIAGTTAMNTVAHLSAENDFWWWVMGVVVFMFFLWLSLFHDTPRLIFIVIGATTALAALIALVMWALHPSTRATGLFFNANGLSGYLLWGITVLSTAFVFLRRRWWVGLLVGLVVLSFALTLSLSAFVIIIFLIGLWAVLHRQNFSRVAPIRIALSGLAIALAVLALWQVPHMQKLMNWEHAKFSLSQRADFARAAIRMGLDRPLAGYGLGSFQVVYPRYAQQVNEQPRYPHSLVLQVFSETGFLGIALFLASVMAIGRAGWSSWQQLEGKDRHIMQGLWLGWLGFLLHSCIDFSWQFSAGQTLWWMTSGLFLGRTARTTFTFFPSRQVRLAIAVFGVLIWTWTGHVAVSWLGQQRAENAGMNASADQIILWRSNAYAQRATRDNLTALVKDLWLRREPGDFEYAESLVHQAIQRNTSDYSITYWQGILARARGDDNRALAAFARAYELDPVFHLEHAIEYARELAQAGRQEEKKNIVNAVIHRYQSWQRYDGSPINTQLAILRTL